MFFLLDSLMANKGRECGMSISPILQEFLIIFLQNRFYPDIEFYGWKDSSENHVPNG